MWLLNTATLMRMFSELTEQLNQAARAADMQFHKLAARADQLAAVTLESRRCGLCEESQMCETHTVFFSRTVQSSQDKNMRN